MATSVSVTSRIWKAGDKSSRDTGMANSKDDIFLSLSLALKWFVWGVYVTLTLWFTSDMEKGTHTRLTFEVGM